MSPALTPSMDASASAELRRSFAGKTVFILGAGSDIGTELALGLVKYGARVIGTYRTPASAERLRSHGGIELLPCDASSPGSVADCVEAFTRVGCPWDVFVSSVGVLDPIGTFFATPFEKWEESVRVNSTAQLRVLHAIYPHRRQPGVSHAVFFAGGGTNSPFRNYSAYCLGKIALIKMCELLDDEAPDLNAVILGTGWVNTKIHRQTLAHPEAAGSNFDRTREFIGDPGRGTSFCDILDCIAWCVGAGRDGVGGRNLSIVHDPWRGGGAGLLRQLREDPAKYKLRRHGNT